MLQVGRGLAAAHAVGLVHRDLKPDNIMVGLDGRARVMDFGLARATDGDDPSSSAAMPIDTSALRSDVTRAGAFVGTPGYMSPEQWNGVAVDARSNQFSYCATL